MVASSTVDETRHVVALRISRINQSRHFTPLHCLVAVIPPQEYVDSLRIKVLYR